MPRAILTEDHLHPAIRDRISALHADAVQAVQASVTQHRIVVVGMAGNPFVRKARRALDTAGLAHHDIDFGGYLSQWRRRNALKMWTGWPTFPMVFVDGVLVGGAEDLIRLLDAGEIRR